MKVLAITPTYLPNIGGIENVIFDLSAELKKNNIMTDIAHISTKFKKLNVEYVDDIKVYNVPLIGNRLIGLAPSLKKIAEQYDLVHVHDPQLCAISFNTVLFARKIPRVLSSHGGFKHTSKLMMFKKIHELFIKKYILNKYDSVLCVSHSDYANYSKYYANAVPALNGVNVAKFNDCISGGVKDLTQWIYWGRLSNNKKIDDLIKMVHACRAVGLDIKLTICGPDFDGLTSGIIQLIAELDLLDAVNIIGAVSDEIRRGFIINSGVFITASEYEGFGLAIVEALAAGLAVFCRDIKPLNSFIMHKDNGLLLDFDNRGKSCIEIATFIRQKENLSILLQDRCKTSAGSYSWSERVKPYILAYKKTINAII